MEWPAKERDAYLDNVTDRTVRFSPTDSSRRRSAIVCLSAWIILTFIPMPSRAETVTVPADRDNTILENQSELSNGLSLYLFAGRTGQIENGARRSLVHFDLEGEIPAGSLVTEVVVTLHASRTRLGDSGVSLHRLLSDWGEGTSMSVEGTGGGSGNGRGADATPGDATWTHTFFDSEFWITPGGDFQEEASASIALDEIDTYSWGSTDSLVADVQTWIDFPDQNFGWALIGEEDRNPSTFRFDSVQNTESPQRPIVTVTFDPPGDPVACCTADAVCAMLSERECTGLQNGFILPANSCAGISSCCLDDEHCNDDQPCTSESCQNGICVRNDLSGPCDDGEDCTTDDVCTDGVCVGTQAGECCSDSECDDDDVCTTDTCVAGDCISEFNTVDCDDGDPCTENDACDAGACAGEMVEDCCLEDGDCNDEDPCTVDTCDDDRCVFTPGSGMSCDDGMICTENDMCDGGSCLGMDIADCCESDEDCDDGDACTEDLCDQNECMTREIENCETPDDSSGPCGAMGILPLFLSMAALFVPRKRHTGVIPAACPDQ